MPRAKTVHSKPMTGHEFVLSGTLLSALPTGALWWPQERLLCVADLHLGKSERIARLGGALLPPFDTGDTLDRLAGEVAALKPRTVICLGDSFDDLDAGSALPEEQRARLTALIAGRRWLWLEGNHDPGPLDLGGTHLADLRLGPLSFRHIATPASGEVSGHYHPKFRLATRGHSVTRPCFLIDKTRVILPAFGSYTGGLSADHPSLRALIDATGIAVLTGETAHAVPLSNP